MEDFQLITWLAFSLAFVQWVCFSLLLAHWTTVPNSVYEETYSNFSVLRRKQCQPGL